MKLRRTADPVIATTTFKIAPKRGTHLGAAQA
jgi:hypothetical protein